MLLKKFLMNTKNNKAFVTKYPEHYDAVYKDKNYSQECKRIIGFLSNKKKISNILDLGCGTCSHSIILSRSGYKIHAVDKSEKMLEIAKKKIEKNNITNIKLINCDVENLNLEKYSYDVVILLFNVVGYLKNINNFFSNIKKFMKKDSMLIFDFWHDQAVEYNGPKKTLKTFKYKDYTIEKKVDGHLDNIDKIINIKISTTKFNNNKILSESYESHSVKFYNLNSLKKIIEKEGFEILKFEDFNSAGQLPNKNNWSAYCVSKFLG